MSERPLRKVKAKAIQGNNVELAKTERYFKFDFHWLDL